MEVTYYVEIEHIIIILLNSLYSIGLGSYMYTFFLLQFSLL